MSVFERAPKVDLSDLSPLHFGQQQQSFSEPYFSGHVIHSSLSTSSWCFWRNILLTCQVLHVRLYFFLVINWSHAHLQNSDRGQGGCRKTERKCSSEDANLHIALMGTWNALDRRFGTADRHRQSIFFAYEGFKWWRRFVFVLHPHTEGGAKMNCLPHVNLHALRKFFGIDLCYTRVLYQWNSVSKM